MVKQNTTYSSHPNRASRAAHEKAKSQYPTYDTSLIRPKKSKKPVVIAVILIFVLLAVIVSVCCFIVSCSTSTLAEGQTVEVTIEEGSSTSKIAQKISEAGVVSNTTVFTATVSQMGVENSLKPGTYIFEGGKTVSEYVKILCDGPDSTSPKLVVTEGMRLKNISKAVEEVTKSRIKAKDFENAASNASLYAADYPFLKSAETNSLEGFLFPKTYSVSSADSSEDIIKKMLNQFSEETKDLDLTYPRSLNFNWYEITTLASIVEKESVSGKNATVASVFYNRLNIGMALNSDATTAYEVGHDPTSEEVHSNSAYSTYTNNGLPPTPICSPGIESLKACCCPEQTNYMYFAFKKDSQGVMQYRFSETFDEHQIALIDLGIV